MAKEDIVPVQSRTLRQREGGGSKYLRIVCISDTHNLHDNLELPDGDFTTQCRPGSVLSFSRFMNKLDKYKHKIMVPGNHEFFPDVISAFFKDVHYLRNEAIEIEGIKIYGTRFKPTWPYTPRGYDGIAQKDWSHIPEDIDILITHQPPTGFGDITWSGKSRGNPALLKRVTEVKPALHLFGHNHEAWGLQPGRDEYRPAEDHPLFTTTFMGCAAKLNSREVRRPIVIDFEVAVD